MVAMTSKGGPRPPDPYRELEREEEIEKYTGMRAENQIWTIGKSFAINNLDC
jgi:hypothetical protein